VGLQALPIRAGDAAAGGWGVEERVADHCCEMMRSQAEYRCATHPDRYDCADCLIDHCPSSDRYGIMIHNDGGGGMIAIAYCPWCGAKLPEPRESEPDA